MNNIDKPDDLGHLVSPLDANQARGTTAAVEVAHCFTLNLS